VVITGPFIVEQLVTLKVNPVETGRAATPASLVLMLVR
jgi:hypothetical protein